MLDKAKALGWIASRRSGTNKLMPEYYILEEMRDAIESGTFEYKCPECGGSEINVMCDDPYYAEPCACTVDWQKEAAEIAMQAYELREELSLSKKLYAIGVEERVKLVKAMEWYGERKNYSLDSERGERPAAWDSGQMARDVLSEIKGQGDDK